ncbi:unnamed protein product [Vitrella brassicaformis CCMP3155]|uniref:Uncharacterized protein n=1 Tax=Vitrella brassicaformis (strain CCMP3155) TaxID=1169540 RepID=A0A0G4GG98_VITBC|nr:unnamed protein product [Vitrella brassicaformis CCMP3155]|eukprot:CEM28649.1 unnamed protein product [Vitrella brassicaformis CCMP3155]
MLRLLRASALSSTSSPPLKGGGGEGVLRERLCVRWPIIRLLSTSTPTTHRSASPRRDKYRAVQAADQKSLQMLLADIAELQTKIKQLEDENAELKAALAKLQQKTALNVASSTGQGAPLLEKPRGDFWGGDYDLDVRRQQDTAETFRASGG